MKSVLIMIAAALSFCAATAFAQVPPIQFKVPAEAGGAFSSFLLYSAHYSDARVLAANTAELHTIPSGYTRVILSGTCNFWAKVGGAAAIPAADVTDGTASDLNPAGYTFNGETSIGFIADSTCIVSMRFYAK